MKSYNMHIVHPRDLKESYISFYLEGKRLRKYNGNCLRPPIFPNRANNPADKSRMLWRLRFELLQAIREDNRKFYLSNLVSKIQIGKGDDGIFTKRKSII